MTIRDKPRLHFSGGAVPPDRLYIERPADQELLTLLAEGEYCNVLASRQIGKSSLVSRVAQQLRHLGVRVAVFPIDTLCATQPPNIDAWYCGLLEILVRKLRLPLSPSEIASWWQNHPSQISATRFQVFFEEHVFIADDSPIVVVVDEIDATLALDYTDDFFIALRAMYNQRSDPTEPIFQKITFCLVGMASSEELVRGPTKTPYNIGRHVELRDFDFDLDRGVNQLFACVSSNLQQGETIVKKIFDWTDGHPFLTVRLCYEFVKREYTSSNDVDPLVEELINSPQSSLAAEVRKNFRSVTNFVQQRLPVRKGAVLRLYQQIYEGKRVEDALASLHSQLKLMGLVKPDKEGRLVVRNLIYSRYFNAEWAEQLLVNGRRNFLLLGLGLGGRQSHLTLGIILAVYRHESSEPIVRLPNVICTEVISWLLQVPLKFLHTSRKSKTPA